MVVKGTEVVIVGRTEIVGTLVKRTVDIGDCVTIVVVIGDKDKETEIQAIVGGNRKFGTGFMEVRFRMGVVTNVVEEVVVGNTWEVNIEERVEEMSRSKDFNGV